MCQQEMNDRSCNYSLHVSPLHTKVIIITGVETERWLLWENKRDEKVYSSWHLGLHAEQRLPNRPTGQMLAANFSN